ncbi:MAG: hypothetical protein WCH07_04410 [Deltaproteobacteria bacterium]
MYEIKITQQSRLELATVSLTVADLRILHPVTVTGLPETLSPQLRSVLQGLVCSSVTPLRVGWMLEDCPVSESVIYQPERTTERKGGGAGHGRFS